MDYSNLDQIIASQLQGIDDEHLSGALEDLVSEMKLSAELYREEEREGGTNVNDPHVGRILGEAVNPEGPLVIQNPSATPLVDEPDSQYARELVDDFVATIRDGVTPVDVPMKDCVVCGDEVKESNTMTAPCGDTYCGGCVDELFDRAAKHELDFPPKCCGQLITLEGARLFLSPAIHDKFQEKSEEFSTRNRTYCFDPMCLSFISPKAIDDDKAKCPACQKSTCTMCKGEAHEGDCPEDPASQGLMTAVAEAGYQQCHECKSIIELNEGCHHIT